MKTATAVLQKYWGFHKFRPAQKTAISHLLNQEDVITLLPTGAGKSICFQVPALAQKGICLVISPLISLMQDQVESLQKRGIKAMMLGGSIPFHKLQILLDNCVYGDYKFLYLSPERLQHEFVQTRIEHMDINFIAIDEAHCISEWGHDFRPAYRKIAILKEFLPAVPFIALTATATPRVLNDIKSNLGLEEAPVVRQSFERENITIAIKRTEDKNHELVYFFEKNPGSSIIYVRNRKLSVQLQRLLGYHGFQAAAFHGGMPLKKKEQLLRDWKAEKFNIIVATTAFGMGIDKENVRNIVHYQLPDSLESYYQEIGRAGRDGNPAMALLIYNRADILTLKNQFLKNIPTLESTRTIYKKMNAYLSIPYGQGQEESYNFNFSEFCHTYNLSPSRVFNTLQLFDQLEIIRLSGEYRLRTEISFTIPPRQLYSFIEKNPSFKTLLHSLLRMQGGFFELQTPINLYRLQARSGLGQKEIITQLKKLHQLAIIQLKIADEDTTIQFLSPREDRYTLSLLTPYLKTYQQNKKDKVEAVVHFATDEENCKTIQLLSYFGESRTTDCHHCSVCHNKYNNEKEQTPKQIAALLLNELQQPLNSKALVKKLNLEAAIVLPALRELLDQKKIKRLDDNRFILRKN